MKHGKSAQSCGTRFGPDIRLAVGRTVLRTAGFGRTPRSPTVAPAGGGSRVRLPRRIPGNVRAGGRGACVLMQCVTGRVKKKKTIEKSFKTRR